MVKGSSGESKIRGKENNDNNIINNNNNNVVDDSERGSNTQDSVAGDYNADDSAGVQDEPRSGNANQNKQETYLSLESQNGGIRNSEVGEREISQNIHTKPINEPTKQKDRTRCQSFEAFAKFCTSLS